MMLERKKKSIIKALFSTQEKERKNGIFLNFYGHFCCKSNIATLQPFWLTYMIAQPTYRLPIILDFSFD